MGQGEAGVSTPAEDAFIYRVHDSRIRYDTHEVSAKSTI